ncbi:polysaccharide biosynthesis tyrosine autokinase [bacterium]|nr:polysaccharide biosynthesis tyrosine autokinase [bacterium]
MQDIQVKQGIDTQAIIGTILRHKFVVLFVFLTFTIVVSYYSLSKPTLYRSSSILYFDNSTNNPVLDILGKNSGLKPIDAGYYDVIMTTDLFNKRFRDELGIELRKFRDESYVQNALLSVSSSQISLRPYKEASQFVEISAISIDSFLVQKMVEVATVLLKLRSAEIDREGLQSGIKFIEEQIEITKSNLEKTELAIQELEKRTDLISKNDEGPLNKIILMREKLAELETQIQIRQSNLSALESQLDSIQSRITGKAVRPEKDSQAELRLKNQIEELQAKKAELFQKLGASASDDNQEIKKINEQITTFREQYVQLLSTYSTDGNIVSGDMNEIWKNVFAKKNDEEIELFILKGQARLYAGLIRNFELRNPNLLEDAIDIKRLNRSKQVYEETLNSLIKQKENFSIQFFGITGNLKIIDPAQPPEAIYRKVFTNIFIGSVLGLLIGVALAFGMDYLDTTIKNNEHINSITNLPVIGIIPPIEISDVPGSNGESAAIVDRLKFKKRVNVENEDKNIIRKKAMISQLNSRSFVSESYRTLRTNIQFANIDTPLRSILIGSSGPSEGKTTTAVNLAISFADMGHKVCLVDTDLRKPKHHLLFEVNESPGLADSVLDNVDLDRTIQNTAIKNLNVLTIGANAINHSEIFSSMRMSLLMNELEKKFDLVIYDTPPILLLTDSIILSSRVDGVLLVVKYGMTEKQNLQNAISALKNVRANIIGIVFNDYSGERRSYYRYAYDSYYTVKDASKENIKI